MSEQIKTNEPAAIVRERSLNGTEAPKGASFCNQRFLKFETKSDLLANTLDIRRNCRHIHLLDGGRHPAVITYLRKAGTRMYYIGSFIKEALRMFKREPPIVDGEFDLGTLPGLLRKDDPIILDIGCNDGSQTLEFLKLFKNSKVFAFEPDLRALDSFRRNVKDSRAKLFDLAISDADGATEFHVSGGMPSPEWKELRPEGWDMSGSIKKPKGHLEMYPWCTFNESIVVKTKRLDTWCREEGIEAIDFIWADVQGAEENLIRGGKEALHRTRYFYTEYCNQELYEGQIGLRGIRRLLPDFEILYRFSGDVLLTNKRWS